MPDDNDKEIEESNLDSTRLDIPSQGGGIDTTHTEIRVAHPSNDSIDLQLKKRKRYLTGLTDGLQSLLSFFKKWTSKDRPQRSSFFPATSRFLSPWVSSPSNHPLSRLLFLGGRFLILVGGLLLLILFFQSFLIAHQIHSGFQWLILGLFVMVLLFDLVLLFLFANPPLFLGIPLLFLMALLLINVLFFPTADPTFFSFFGKAPAFFLNQLFLILLGLEILLIISLPLPWLMRGLWCFFALFGALGFLFNLSQQVPLESSWLGVGILQQIPYFYLQPVYFTLEIFSPLSFIFNLLILIVNWSKLRAKDQLVWTGINLGVLLLTSILGIQLLQNHRIPNILSSFTEAKPGMGMSDTDTQGRKIRLRFISSSPTTEADFVPHYRLTLTPVAKKSEKSSLSLTLKVSDPFGFPVFFLTKNDFLLFIDDAKITSWSLKSLPDQYLIETNLPPVGPDFSIKNPEGGRYAKGGKVEFTLAPLALAPNSVPPVSYEIFIDGISVAKNSDLKRVTVFSFPLNDVAPGNHLFEVEMMSESGAVARESQSIEVQPGLTGLIVASPMEGDTFNETLSVAIQVKLSPDDSPVSAHYFIDDNLLQDQISPPYSNVLDTRNLAIGAHRFRVVVNLSSGRELESTIKVTKGETLSLLSFTSPTFGQYLSAMTPVSVAVTGDPPLATLSTIALFLNDDKIYEWQKPTGDIVPFQWDTTKLSPGDYLLRAVAKRETGEQTSTWIPVLTGEGSIRMMIPEGKIKPPYEKIIFLLDASISVVDGWSGKSKWDWEKSLLKLEPLTNKLKGVDVGVVLFGAKAPYAYEDCHDAFLASPVQDFNRVKIAADLDPISPIGISSLIAGVQVALKEKPQKIILVTDGIDSCSTTFPSIVTQALGISPKTVLDVVFLDEGSESTIKFVKRLAEVGGGQFLNPKNGKDLLEEVGSLVSLNYQLFHGDQKILQAPLDGTSHSFRPGDYTLKVLMNPPVADFSFSLRNGQNSSLKLVLSAGGAKVVDASPPIQ